MNRRMPVWAWLPTVCVVVSCVYGSTLFARALVPSRKGAVRVHELAPAPIEKPAVVTSPKSAQPVPVQPVSAPRDAIKSSHASEANERNTCRRRGIPEPQPVIAPCESAALNRVRAWSPDAVVVLGGGILLDGKENCATAQRAHAALDLVSRAGLGATIVLSGRGPSRYLRALDSAEQACMTERLTRESRARGLTGWERHRLIERADRAAQLARGAPTESDLMCATMLRERDRSEWKSVLARVLFEPRSDNTVENAQFTAPLLARRHFRRVLVVTTPVLHKRRPLDNHAARALGDFQHARAKSGGRFNLGALGCPYMGGGPTWMSIE